MQQIRKLQHSQTRCPPVTPQRLRFDLNSGSASNVPSLTADGITDLIIIGSEAEKQSACELLLLSLLW